MTVRGSKSEIAGPLETVLDENEDFIGPKVWDLLEAAYEEVDDAAKALEKRVEELESELEEAQARITELESEDGE